ncbi:hypothetical protein [Streptomyces sp. enrichment culture]|uniref:hypothetical protein n=1 Tax=Streptomyces sp. enrichment culture TaxID=1795815 RepID=UPI003F54E75D
MIPRAALAAVRAAVEDAREQHLDHVEEITRHIAETLLDAGYTITPEREQPTV